MALFEKKFCDLCGNKVNALTRQKLSEGYLCSDCKHKLSSLSTGWKTRTVDDVKRHLEQREQNKQKFANFRQSSSVGANEKLVVDYNSRQFYFAVGKDYSDGNPEIFGFNQLQDFWIEIGYTSMQDSDHDGIPDSRDHYDNRTGRTNSIGNLLDTINNIAANNNGMNMIPPALIPYVRDNRISSSSAQRISSVKAKFVVSHDFITEVTLSVDSYISDNNYNELSKAFMNAQQIIQVAEQIRGNNQQMQNNMGYQQNGMPMQNNMGYQQNGMPMQNNMDYQQNGMPMQNNMGYQQNGMPMQNNMGYQQNGMPMQNNMGYQHNGMPMQNNMGYQQAAAVNAAIRCPNCGWMPENQANPPKFCNNCGSPLSGNF